jgi:fatty-acyl-CoA synthase
LPEWEYIRVALIYHALWGMERRIMRDPILTTGDVLERAARLWPNNEAVVADGRRVTYAQLNQMSDRLANGLAELDITQGDRVAVMLPNWPEFVCAYYALAKMGVVIVPMNTRFRRREVEHIVPQTEAKALIIPDRFLGFNYVELLDALWPRLRDLRHIIVKGEELAPNMLSFDEVIAAGDERAPGEVQTLVRPTVDDLLAICFTSGTTGQAKGALVTHVVPATTATLYNEVFEVTAEDTILITLALSQIAVFGGFLLPSAYAGMRAVLLPRFKPESALELVEREKVTYLIGVPTMWVQELAQLEVADYDISSLRVGFVAGAPCPPDVARAVEDRMGLRLHIAYGLTETAGNGTIMLAEDTPPKRFTTVGRPLPGMELRIVDDEHNPVSVGERGEVALRGRGLFKGYYKRPEATARAIDGDGWFYTGDLGTVDEESYVQIVGRLTDMILRGGYNVYAAEVESCLLSHPDVTNAAVFGLPDPVMGETVHAHVIPKPGASLSAQALVAYCREEMANYKVPDEITLVSELPLSSMGKVQKFVLREEALSAKSLETASISA